MMNQESYVNIEDLRKQGWTIKEIAAEMGYHPRDDLPAAPGGPAAGAAGGG